jgi:hypothetical protein
MEKKVFISHSSEDKSFVRRLKRDLGTNGIGTWVDEDEMTLGDYLSEKLAEALEQSTHFIIVMSPTSLESPWVKMELESAIKHIKSDIRKKIIPIKYKRCEMPSELNKLLYIDISGLRRIENGDKIDFVSPEDYGKALARICDAVDASRQLSSDDVKSIKKEIEKEGVKIEAENNESNSIPNHIRASYKVLAYANAYTRERYRDRILERAVSAMELVARSKIRPVLLPPLLKHVLPDLHIGDTILLSRNFGADVVGHFAGYRKDDMFITVDGSMRKALRITKGLRYDIEIAPKDRRLNFVRQSSIL